MGLLEEDGASRLKPPPNDTAFIGRLVGVRGDHPPDVPSGKGGTGVDTTFGEAIEEIA